MNGSLSRYTIVGCSLSALLGGCAGGNGSTSVAAAIVPAYPFGGVPSERVAQVNGAMAVAVAVTPALVA